MNRRYPILSVLAVVFGMAQQIGAAEIRGHVQTSAGDTAAIIVDGDTVPNISDPATIFFKLPGTDDEVLVANGKVTGIAGDSVTVKIDDAKGKVEKNQLVRITSANPKAKDARSIPSSPPSAPAQSEAPGPRRGKLIRTEDFSKTSPRRTEKGGTIERVGGELHMTADSGMLISPISSEKLRDFYAEWSMRSETISTTGIPGLLFRMSMENKTLSSSGVVLIDQDEHGNRLRFYCTDKRGMGSHSDQDFMREGLFKQKEKNQIGVEVSGQMVRVFINNTLASTFTSEKLPADGLLAFVARGSHENPCSAYFDDLRVYSLSASSTEPLAKSK